MPRSRAGAHHEGQSRGGLHAHGSARPTPRADERLGGAVVQRSGDDLELAVRRSAGIKGRAARWRSGTVELLKPLNDEHKEALRRARAGWTPAYILGPVKVTDTGRELDPPLKMIEEIARAMLRTYEWPKSDGTRTWPPSGLKEELRGGGWREVGPDWIPDPNGLGIRQNRYCDRAYPIHDEEGNPVEGRPDFRFELLALIQLSAELKIALSARCLESAILRSMTIGTLFGRIASMVLDGPSTAIGAATALCKSEGHKNLRESQREKLGDRNAEIRRLDDQCLGLAGKSERATHIKPKLDKWVTGYNEDHAPEDRVNTLSIYRISRMLPSRK
jgi:hypothetical protein